MCDVLRSACLSVSLSVCPLAYLRNYVQISPNVLYIKHLALARSSSDSNAMQHIMYTSGFLGDIMFSHNPPNSQRRTFRPVRQVAAAGSKSAVFDCILSPGINCMIALTYSVSYHPTRFTHHNLEITNLRVEILLILLNSALIVSGACTQRLNRASESMLGIRRANKRAADKANCSARNS